MYYMDSVIQRRALEGMLPLVAIACRGTELCLEWEGPLSLSFVDYMHQIKLKFIYYGISASIYIRDVTFVVIPF